MSTGEDYFDSEEFKELLSRYEESVSSGNPAFMDADELTDIADYYNYMGQEEQAKEAIDYAIELYPTATLPNVFKTREALTRGAFEEAFEYAERIEDKDDPDYQYLQAELLIAQDRIDEADQLLRSYFETVSPDEYQDFVMDVANIYNDYGLSDKALEWMMRTKGDGSSDFKELMARTLFGLGKYQDSERIFNELLDRNPYSKRYWNALANAQFMREDYSSAITSSEYAIAIDPNDAESILSKANGLYRLNNFEEALKYYERYNQLDTHDEFGMLHQGTCLVNLGRYEEAVQLLGQAIDACTYETPYLPQLYQELGFAYSALHMPEEALQCIDQADRLDCDHIEMMVLRGHILLENNRLPDAEEAFKEAIIKSDSQPSVLLRIMVSLYDNKYVKAAYTMFKKFFTIVDDSFNEGYSYMALCCWDMAHEQEFLMYLRIATERNPREARMVLGHLFPEDMAAKDYYKYMYNQLNRLRK